MKQLLIWLVVGVELASIAACSSTPAFFSPLPNTSKLNTRNFLQHQDGIIDKAVISALSQQNEVPVIIELRLPLSVAPDTPSDYARTQQVNMTQERVLNTLTQDDFRLKYRSDIIFVMAGWVTTQGVMKLSRNPHVVKVSVDGASRSSDLTHQPRTF